MYHFNVVLVVKARSPRGAPEKEMQLERARLILDCQGIKRLEPLGVRDRRP